MMTLERKKLQPSPCRECGGQCRNRQCCSKWKAWFRVSWRQVCAMLRRPEAGVKPRGHEEMCVGCWERDCFGCAVIKSSSGEEVKDERGHS